MNGKDLIELTIGKDISRAEETQADADHGQAIRHAPIDQRIEDRHLDRDQCEDDRGGGCRRRFQPLVQQPVVQQDAARTECGKAPPVLGRYRHELARGGREPQQKHAGAEEAPADHHERCLECCQHAPDGRRRAPEDAGDQEFQVVRHETADYSVFGCHGRARIRARRAARRRAEMIRWRRPTAATPAQP